MPTKATTTTATKKPAAKAPAKAAAPKAPEHVNGSKIGVVESDKRSQTRTVVVNYQSKHPKYGKYIAQRTVLQVHDINNEARSGDVVEVAPCKPVSKTKTWRLVKIVEQRSKLTAALTSAKELAQ
jgi:small subunit ribosomal protein S17